MTEGVCQRFADFDQWSSLDAISAMYEGQLFAVAAIQPALADMARAADKAAKKLNKTGRLVYVGAGTSGRLAAQDGAELGPTCGWPQDRLVFCIAGGLAALTISAEGAEDDHDEGHAQIQAAHLGAHDVVIGVAASGKTPFTLGALQAARQAGATTIGIANNPNTPILNASDFAILAETGSELIAGSTRMKAGTAQKAILSMLSTAIMTRLGHVYKGYMVDMVASNHKLEGRAVNMICAIAGCTPETAKSAFTHANKHIKTAVLLAKGQTQEHAKTLLAQSKGNLRQVLSMLEEP